MPNAASTSDTAAARSPEHLEKRWPLPAALKEISGITWIGKNQLLAIEDLNPQLYILSLAKDAAIEKTIPFKYSGKKFDVEDVTIANDIVYALWSHGDIYKITNWRTAPVVRKIKTFLTKQNNTEGICYNPVNGNLLVACKDESDVSDAKKSTRAIYEFDIKSETLREEPFLLIHKKDFEKLSDKKIDFYPSAIAVHPTTHDVYILSTKENKCIARFSYDKKLLELKFLDESLFPQPEGICFAPDGTMFISTEGRHGEPASITEFDYSK